MLERGTQLPERATRRCLAAISGESPVRARELPVRLPQHPIMARFDKPSPALTTRPWDYRRYLFYERRVRSVTANRWADVREFFAFDAAHRLSVTTTPYLLGEADQALADLAADRVRGAAVLLP